MEEQALPVQWRGCWQPGGGVESLVEKSVVYEKAFAFGVRIIKLYQYLEKERKISALAKQILKSGTSIGANISEANEAQSRNDFIAKMYISLKEARETEYWLKLLQASDLLDQKQFESIYKDLEDIIRILIQIIKTAKQNKKYPITPLGCPQPLH